MKKRFLSIVIAITLFTTSIFIPKNFTDILAANGEEIIPPGTYTLPANDEYDRTSAGWSLVWNDEFNGNSLNTKFWSADNNGYGGWNDELQFYKGTEGDNYYVDGGTLKIIAKREEITGTGLDHYKKEVQNKKFDYTSARIQSQDKVAIKYGKLEARLRFDTFHGAWPAFWLYGNDGVAPRIGEIDILEATNRDNIAYGTAHWSIENPDAEDGVEVLHSGGSTGVPLNKDLDFSKFHVYGIEWSENQVIWYLDDEVYWTTQITDENMDDLRKSQYFLLNFAVGGEMTGISEYYGNTEQVDMGKTATMEVDWVRAYKKTTPSSSILVEYFRV